MPGIAPAPARDEGLLPEADIDRCISFSRVRCVFSLVSLLLLVTDIPRSGLGVKDVFQLFPNKIGPSTAMFFGPWAYPVAHIWRNESRSHESTNSSNTSTSVRFLGTKGSAVIKHTSLWSYEYDSTSIGMRGVIQLLDVPVTPPPNRTTTTKLELKTTWSNLDALVSTIRANLSATISLDDGLTAASRHPQQEMHLDIATVNVWIDRLHHYLYRFAKLTMRWRLHSVHSYTKANMDPAEALSICLPTRRYRPAFCDSLYKWRCTHPLNASLPKVPIWDQVDLRLSTLQRKYPGLALDLTIFTTFNPSTSTVSLLSAFFESEVLEITMLTRGRNCTTSPHSTSGCSTVFVDDYRYERGVLISSIAEWYAFTAALRAIAQLYVWIRLALLFGVAYTVEKPAASCAFRAVATLRTMSKIPFQVVVYGSLFPVLAYVVAHLIDCSFVDLFLEMYWTTVNGALSFDLFTFAQHASVQMRNVWIIALAMKATVFVRTRLMPSWQPRDGILGVRGLTISLCSMLSVFGPFRSLSFRDSSVVSVLALGSGDRGGRRMDAVEARPVSLFNVSVEGLPKDMKMTLLAIIAVIAVAVALKLILRVLRPRFVGGVLFGQSVLVPYTAGMFWSPTSLSVRFSIRLTDSDTRSMSIRRIAPTPSSVRADASSPTKQNIQQAHSSRHRWTRVLSRSFVSACYSVLGIDRSEEKQVDRESLHDRALRLDERTVETNSVVRLINIAMMTDPWTLFRLRVLGREVYLYEATEQPRARGSLPAMGVSAAQLLVGVQVQSPALSAQPSRQVVLLPCCPDMMVKWTGYGKEKYRLVGQMSSRDLPWPALLQCG